MKEIIATNSVAECIFIAYVYIVHKNNKHI